MEVSVIAAEVAVGAERSAVRADALVDVDAGGKLVRFAVEEKRRAPYPNELPGLEQRRHTLEQFGRPLLVAPFIPVPVGGSLTEAGWSWADDDGNYDVRGPGLRLSQRRTTSAPKPARRLLPTGSGSWAIIRSLIASGGDQAEEPTATALARRAGVTQARASQVLGALARLELVHRTDTGRWRPQRPALLDRLLHEYPGPGGSERYWYSLDEPMEVTVALARLAGSAPFVVSADVGPDLIAPWRRPSVVILYAGGELPLDRIGLVPATSGADANVIVRAPRDRSVFPAPPFVAEAAGVDVPLADPTQMMWDLEDLGGADRLEAAGEVRRWILERP